MSDPIARLRRLDVFRARLAAMHARVGIVFFMPATRERFQRRLYRKWQALGRERDMLLGVIKANPDLRAKLYGDTGRTLGPTATIADTQPSR
jgi:hypothetical protein